MRIDCVARILLQYILPTDSVCQSPPLECFLVAVPTVSSPIEPILFEVLQVQVSYNLPVAEKDPRMGVETCSTQLQEVGVRSAVWGKLVAVDWSAWG